ncbi:MAG: peptidase M4 [Methylobacterium sp.]|nr:peptidase M4 [Methylobacterium sp.]
MNKTQVLAAIIASLFVAAPAMAADKHTGRLESCMKAALAKQAGTVQTLEAEIEKGKAIYEFDIRGADGKEWEVECDAKSGKVTEVEEEVTAEDPRFKSKAKVSLDDAKKAALAAQAGEIIETEYSLEANGNPSYEFDIKTAAGKEMEVEIDAVTGKLQEDPEEEVYQIGEEK